jgi:membrane-associated protease RseP (regulator of RpoE activity)
VGALGVVVFAVALLLSIALHELGHLLTAKRFGMKASRYFIGMGPTLWSTWRGETEYGVKAFPVGGFVKIVGMTQIEELDDPRDEPRAFWRFPAPQRAVVLAAGSFMHFVIALVVAYGALLAWGFPTEDTLRIGTVAECLTPTAGAENDACAGQPPAPAKVSGIRKGDRVAALDGTPVKDWKQFSDAIHAHPAGPADVVVTRAGKQVPVRVEVVRTKTETKPGVFEDLGRIGVSPGEVIRYTPISGVAATGRFVTQTVTGSVKALGEIPGKIPQLFKDTAKNKPRTVDDGGAVSVVDLGRFSGQAFETGNFQFVLLMLASLNVFVGLFNLLPLLPLDGGHLAILGFEAVRSRLARLFGRRDPGRVDLRRLMPAMVAFIVLLGSVSLVLLYAGIANPIENPFGG